MIIIIIFNADDYLYAIMMMLGRGCVKTENNDIHASKCTISCATNNKCIPACVCVCVNKNSTFTAAAPIEVICNFGSMRDARTEIIVYIYENVVVLTIKHSFMVFWFLFILIFISSFFFVILFSAMQTVLCIRPSHRSVFHFATASGGQSISLVQSVADEMIL